ncbi:MAG: DUF72 domain-containing protein [Limisphaerales bacterium]
MPFDPDSAGDQLRKLALAGVHIGTSSWKYPGWIGQLYSEERYRYRGRLSQTRFERQCLSEYARTFTTVGVDASYYRFPEDHFLADLASQAPEDFRFSFKVTDEITVKRFTRLPRFGDRAGQPNANFLNADLFASAFLAPLEPYRSKVGVLMFEFSRFYPTDFARGREFAEALETFLSKLPGGWRYGVEIRNAAFLHPDYFAMLGRHGVAHVFNSWESMPSLPEQLALPGAFASPDHTVARLLLRPGRSYDEAVTRFQPYDRIQDPYPEGRAAVAQLLGRIAKRDGGVPRVVFVYVNNRFEGNALQSIAALLGVIDPGGSASLPHLPQGQPDPT